MKIARLFSESGRVLLHDHAFTTQVKLWHCLVRK